MDIDQIYNENISGTRGQNNGLKRLYLEICGVRMKFKDKRVCLTAWNSPKELTNAQIHYAADDALAGYRILMSLMEMLNEGKEVEESECVDKEWCKEYIDREMPKKRKSNRHRKGKHKSRKKRKGFRTRR